jgi:hypothetical protein
MQLDARTRLFVALAGAFITCLLVGDIIGGKLYQVVVGGLPLTISVGMIRYRSLFLTDRSTSSRPRATDSSLRIADHHRAQVSTRCRGPRFARAGIGVRPESFDNIFASSTRSGRPTFAYPIAQFVTSMCFRASRITRNRLPAARDRSPSCTADRHLW